MKKIIIAIVAVILIASGIFFATVFADTRWTDKTEFGEWGQEILLEYEDGSTSNILGIYHNDKKVSAFRYILTAKATGDFDYVEIDLSNYQIEVFIQNTNDMHGITRNDFVSKDIMCDNQWANLCNIKITDEDLNPPSDQLPFGDYVISIQPGGSINYRGFMVGRTDWGNYESTGLPSAISFFVTLDDDRGLTVEFDNEVGEEYDDWSWSFQSGYQDEILITQEMVNCLGGSRNPEDIFASILTKIEVIFQRQDGTLKSWSYQAHLLGYPQTLLTIEGDSTCRVSVTQDCVLTIDKC